MSDEIVIAGKSFVPSKKAAELTSYAQDYIGQLARGGQIEAQRVGGLWYVNLESLTGYKTQAGEFKPQQPLPAPSQDPESIVSFDGKDYISASRGAKITGYNQDYIGQLARGGKILSRQIGNRWYVERAGLLTHKNEKDRLLAAVQSESVGIARKEHSTMQDGAMGRIAAHSASVEREYAGSGPVLKYFRDEKDLMPILGRNDAPVVSPIKINRIDTKIMATPTLPRVANSLQRAARGGEEAKNTRSGSRLHLVTKSVAALTIVVVLSYGLITLKDDSKYASESIIDPNPYLAGAASAGNALIEAIEALLTKEISYTRSSER